ncbi:MAG: Zn-ribbon domain-containing OB-fold protein [Acidimicrobiales bacterium]
MDAIAPQPDSDSAAWWKGLREHRILLQLCGECRRPRHPPLPRCPWCATRTFAEVESAGRGVVYAFVTAHVAVSPGYAAELPYTVATVELDEGPRLVGRVESLHPVAIGAGVVARFRDHPSWTELYFATDPHRT